MPSNTTNLALYKKNPATDGANTFNIDTMLNENWDKIDKAVVARQTLINGGFAVNQRVVSGTVTLTAGAYGHDRWKAGSGGCTYTFATVNNVTTITITAGSLVQVIEGINLVSGTYTLSWTGTAQGKIGAGSYSASGVTGAATGGTNLSIEFNVGTLTKVQFNAGDQVLPFQPRSFADDLVMCQRYYERLESGAGGRQSFGSATAVSSASLMLALLFRTEKRIIPTMTQGGTFRIMPGGGAVTVSFFDGNKSSCNINCATTALTANQAWFVQSSDSGGWIALDAEL